MSSGKDIREGIRRIAGDTPEVLQGFVNEVHRDHTCDVEVDDNVVVYGVRLNVIPDTATATVITPAKGSAVVIARIELGQNYHLLSCAKADKVEVRVGSKTLEITADRVTVNEGKNGGTVLVNPLKAELTKMEANFQALRAATLTVATKLNAIDPTALAAFNAALAGVQPVDLTKLENDKLWQ